MNIFDTPADQPDEREELFNKWKTKFPDAPEELLNAKVESDLYVRTLERQKDEFRNDNLRFQEELKTRENLQSLIDKLNVGQATPPATPPASQEKPISGLSPEDVENLVLSKIEQTKKLEAENKNFEQVQSKLRERFGSNTSSVLREQAQTLGLSDEDVNNLAKKSPEAFFRIMGLNQQVREDFIAPPRSGTRNDNFAPRTEKRTWSWYQNLKKTNYNLWSDPKTQLQMHKDAATLGAAFEDGDFNAYGPNS
jgi:hypothetical protein